MPALHTLLAALGMLLVSGCDAHFTEGWPDTGERRFAGRAQTIGGERRAFGFWTFWYPGGEVRQAQGWFDGGAFPDLTLTAAGGTRVPREGRTKLWSFWDEQQTLLAEGKYAHSRRDDLWACWREDGELCCTGYFADGLPEGFHVTWRDGVRRDEHSYAGGLLHGQRVVRDASGNAIWTGEYASGGLVHSKPAGAPEPPLHLLETCAEAAEEGQRLALDAEVGSATRTGPEGPPGG
jgi:hypothetical protein